MSSYGQQYVSPFGDGSMVPPVMPDAGGNFGSVYGALGNGMNPMAQGMQSPQGNFGSVYGAVGNGMMPMGYGSSATPQAAPRQNPNDSGYGANQIPQAFGVATGQSPFGLSTVGSNTTQNASRVPPAFSLAPAPAPWQQNESALSQLSYDQLYPKIMAQYGNMLNLAGQGEAFQQNQNNMLTGQQTGAMTDQLLAEGLGNSTVLPSMVNNAQSLGALRGENIAANAANQKLGVYGQQAQAMQNLPAPLAPGAYGTGGTSATIPNMAKTLFGPAAAVNQGQQQQAQQNQQGAFSASNSQWVDDTGFGSVRF